MESNCRICFDEPGTYNIFTDEFLFDSKPQKQTKIYIILNNFLHEKLYATDEFSQLICKTCCNSLSESYAFMSKIRSSEEKLKTLPTPCEAPMIITTIMPNVPSLISKIEQQSKHHIFDVIQEESPTDFIIETTVDSIVESPPTPPKIVQTNKRKKGNDKTSTSSKTSLFKYTHYELEQESGQNVITVAIKQRQLELSEKDVEQFSFDLSYLNHADETYVYKCNYCIKGFSTSELLVKHTVISHLCVLCHKIFANYKDLNHHLKSTAQKKDLFCKFCENSFDHASYRQHLKTRHKLITPIHIGIT